MITSLDITFKVLDLKDTMSFNGTTIHYKDNRYICMYHNTINCGLASCFLDYADGEYTLVEGTTHKFGDTGFVDTRIIKFDNEYYILNADFTKWVQTQHLRKLIVTDQKILIDSNYMLNFPHIENIPNYGTRSEKNWCPMEYDGKFYIIYSLNPHRFIEVDIHGSGNATLKYETVWHTYSWWEEQNWEEPRLRLNTSPIKLPDGTYLSVFHTLNFSQGDPKCNENIPGNVRSYWTGFYLFEGKPPFRVKKISKTPVFYPVLDVVNGVLQKSCNPYCPFNLFLDGDNVIMTGSGDTGFFSGSVPLEKILESLEDVLDLSINW